MATLDVCVVGEINLDLILYGLPKELVLDRELLASGLALTLGSSSAIFAHNLSMLGNKVGFISKTGGDALGKMALERLSVAGVDVGRVSQATGRTATGLTVVLPYLRQRYILTYPGTMFELQYSDIDLGYVRSARHLHVSSFFLHRALRPRILDLFREAKGAGLSTSLDTNDDPENKWDRDLLEVLKYVDIFLPNDREAKKIARTDDLSQAINLLAGLAKIVVVKRGSSAAICRSGQEQCQPHASECEGCGRYRCWRQFRRRIRPPVLDGSEARGLPGICKRGWSVFHNKRRRHRGFSRSGCAEQLYSAALERQGTELGYFHRALVVEKILSGL